MRKHKPNIVPFKLRLLLLFVVALLLAFILAEFATGYTFIPTKHGGYLLSGISNIMIACGMLSLCIAALLPIIDHYDKRPNEKKYQELKQQCYRITAYLYLTAPFVEVIVLALKYNGIDMFSGLHGFAENSTFYNPYFNHYISYIQPLISSSLIIGGVSFSLWVIGIVIAKYVHSVHKKWPVMLFALGMLGISYLIMVMTLNDFLIGEIDASHLTYKALNDPAKFNAVVISNFVLGAFAMLGSMIAVVGVATNRIKINNVKIGKN